MPSPPSLTGVPGDPMRDLPNPQTYDTSAPDVVIDDVTHLVWQKTVTSGALTWADAVALCANLELGGRSDWRVPSRIELVSLVDFSAFGHANDVAFPDSPQEQFWTCSQGPADPLAAYVVLFGNGSTGADYKTTPHFVRCVAGAPDVTPPPARYDLSSPGEVRDTKTLLRWAAAVSTLVNWGQAFEYCGNLGPDWRLPSLMELQTLIDEAEGGVDQTAFPDTPADFYWTSSAFGGTPDQFYFVSIGIGNTWWLRSTEMHLARCVR